MSTIDEIYHATIENMRVLSPLRVYCLEGENGHDVAVIYDFQYLSVMFIYFLYQYEKNCFVSPDVSLSDINKRNWYYSGGIYCNFAGLTDVELRERSDFYLSLRGSQVYRQYSKEVFYFMSQENCDIQFHYILSKCVPISTELKFQIFLDNANVYIQENGCGL